MSISEDVIIANMKNLLDNHKILIVDDDDLFRAYAMKAFDFLHPFSASTGVEAREIFNNEKPDITLLDVCLPDDNGIDLLKEFLEIKPDAYIVIITGHNTEAVIKSALDSGAAGYIMKPFNIRQIKKLIVQYIKNINDG
ncbi:MAG: response regulator [Pseudomonadota bacterium]